MMSTPKFVGEAVVAPHSLELEKFQLVGDVF